MTDTFDAVLAEAPKIAALLDDRATDHGGDILLSTAARLIRRLAASGQPGSAVQGEAEQFFRDECALYRGKIDLLMAEVAEADEEGRAFIHKDTIVGIITHQATPPPAPAAEQVEQRSTHRVHRGAEWLPCYCASTMDHLIGSESAQPEARGVEDMMIPAVSPNGSDEDMLKYLDELLAAQGTLMFARGNYNEDQAECFGVAILDFMRLYGMRLRAKLTATPNPVRAEQPEGKWKLVPVEATPEMVSAARRFSVPGYCIAAEQWPSIYAAMLAAAPTQEGK